MKHVFILGAGASREAGGPLMWDFLDHAEVLRRTTAIDTEAFDLVFRGVKELQAAHSKAVLDIDNVEAVMIAFEMAALFGRLGSLEEAEVAKLPSAITRVVAQTVEELVNFDIRRDQGVRTAPPYTALADALLLLLRSREQVSILTFNYDLGADFAIDNIGYSIDYGLSDDPVQGGAVPLLKLHGSLAWTTYVDKPDSIFVLPVRELSSRYQLNPGVNQKTEPFRVREQLQSYKSGLSGQPVIVPPTWGKGTFYRTIRNIWRRAAAELREAENIYVMGFSLPPSDEFFKLLYALGTAGATRLKRFWVFDPGADVERRFRAILGQAAQARFEYHPLKFSEALPKLSMRLQKELRLQDFG